MDLYIVRINRQFLDDSAIRILNLGNFLTYLFFKVPQSCVRMHTKDKVCGDAFSKFEMVGHLN